MADPPTWSGASTETDAGEGGQRILYPVRGEESETVLHFAASVASTMDAELLVGHLDVDDTAFSMEASRSAARTKLKAQNDPMDDVSIESRSLHGPSTLDAVATAVNTFDVDLVVLGDDLSEELEAALAKRITCDTVVVNEKRPQESIGSLLLPIAGGPHTDAALSVAGAVAEANDAPIELIHVTEGEPGSKTVDDAQELLDTGHQALSTGATVDTRVIEGDDVDVIIEESGYHDVTIIGAPTKGRLKRFVFGSTANEVRENAQNTVAMVRRN